MADAERRRVLFYEYVPDIVERRRPFGESHLGALRAAKDDGRILLTGPLSDPTDPGNPTP